MHGGRLQAASGGVGSGATFTFAIDLAPTGKVASETVDSKRHSLAGLDVLIVEDSPDTLTLLSTIFRREGASVTAAASAAEALTCAIDKRPHIIVSDIGMPEVDGYQLLEQLRVLPGLGNVPAIAISGYASEEDRERALAAGYLALVPKPIDVEVLFTLIQDLKAPV
jgi:CheY-like chemotaxis protein